MIFRRKKTPAAAGKRRAKALVLGLDGVPKGLLEQLAGEGTMPFMAELLKVGSLHQTQAALPEVSNVNWTSFMTGADPGAHGIFGFTDLDPKTYGLVFPSFPDVRTETFWDRLGREGRRCLVINQPGCYPARSIPGVLVSGFVAVDLKRAVTPQSHAAALEGMGYRIDVDTKGCAEDPDKLFAELDACLDGRVNAARHFQDTEPWDFVEIVITGTDRLQHFLWTSCAGDGPEAERARAYYRRCDGLLRDWAEAFLGADNLDGLFLLSDHGFCGLQEEFYLNNWLVQEGYLRFDADPPASYADMAAASRAFALDPGRVYIHRRDRFARGTVMEEDVEALRDELHGALSALTHNGAPAFERVWRPEEIYAEPERGKGPDLLCTPRRGLDVKGAIRRTGLSGPSVFTGMHTWDDAFFWAREPHGEARAVADLAKPILNAVLAESLS